MSDALGFDHALRVHQLLSARDAQIRAPGLLSDGMLGAALVWEAVVPQVQQLARELAWDARRYGAALHPHTRVERLHRTAERPGSRERVGGVFWRNALSGETGHAEAALVILAAGSGQRALLDEGLKEKNGERETQFFKTVSVALPPLPGLRDALAFPQEDPPGLLLAVPGENSCWAGSLTRQRHEEKAEAGKRAGICHRRGSRRASRAVSGVPAGF